MYLIISRLARSASILATLATLSLLAACSSSPSEEGRDNSTGSIVTTSPGAGIHPVTPPEPSSPPRMTPGAWRQVPGWAHEDPTSAWSAFRSSCLALASKPKWRSVCSASQRVDPLDNVAIKRFFEDHFTPYQLTNSNGSTSGTITGYYEPELQGSLTRHGAYQTPLYAKPANVSRWRLNRPRAQLLSSGVLAGHELVWVNDPVEAAYLQIQGSGLVKLDNGKAMRLGFADTNNQSFRSFARWLIDRHEITYAQATLPGIRAWAKRNPARVEQMLNSNPRYVYFRELTLEDVDDKSGPIGALGVPLTPERSIAIDPSRVPLGAPVFLATTHPGTGAPIQRLMMAQDTGSAIKGAVRADFFWGRGDTAGEIAGKTKQRGQMWVLEPK